MNIFFDFKEFVLIPCCILILISFIGLFGFLMPVACFGVGRVCLKLASGGSIGAELFADLFVLIMCIILIIILVLGFRFIFGVFAPVEFREFRRDLQNFHNTELLNVPKLKHLLQNGRKSLATVRDVQYRAESEKQYPEFVLRYAFNPPDDSMLGDLIHEIVVPYDPALKPGDVLPILYTVSEDSTEVMSMPFPFPTKALPELSSCYCKTSSGVIQSW